MDHPNRRIGMPRRLVRKGKPDKPLRRESSTDAAPEPTQPTVDCPCPAIRRNIELVPDLPVGIDPQPCHGLLMLLTEPPNYSSTVPGLRFDDLVSAHGTYLPRLCFSGAACEGRSPVRISGKNASNWRGNGSVCCTATCLCLE